MFCNGGADNSIHNDHDHNFIILLGDVWTLQLAYFFHWLTISIFVTWRNHGFTYITYLQNIQMLLMMICFLLQR